MFKVSMLSVRYGKKSMGGAATSFMNIIYGSKKDQNLKIKIFSRTTTNLIKKFLVPIGISYYLYYYTAKVAKIPIVALIHHISDVCPKYIDVIKYGIAWKGLEGRVILHSREA